MQMREELQQFASERAERIRLLQERQMRELEQFDEESTRRGFRYVINSVHNDFKNIFFKKYILTTKIILYDTWCSNCFHFSVQWRLQSHHHMTLTTKTMPSQGVCWV